MITATFGSRKCGTALFTVILLLVCVQWIFGETIIILFGEGGGQPTVGDLNYKINCMISNLENPAIAWSKDGNILFWSTGNVITDVDATGDYKVDETGTKPNINVILTITQVRTYHSGIYKCFTATGDTQEYTVGDSSVISITVINGSSNQPVTDTTISSRPDGLGFPNSEWPRCFPQSDMKALIYRENTVRCVSAPGTPPVEVNLYNASNGQLIRDTSLHKTNNRIERIYTYEVIPTNNVDQFYCQIIDRNGKNRRCTMGSIGIGLFEYDYLPATRGTSPFFQCLAGSENIHWSTDPPIEPSRLEMTTDLLYIQNVEMTDNGTKVICRVDGFNLQDQVYLIVTPGFTPDIEASTVLLPLSSLSFSLSNKDTTSPFDSTIVTSTIPSTALEGLPIYVIAAIGGGGGLLLIALISCIVAICCCRCRNRESDIKFEDGGTTRISTGYMWDKELSHMVHESPRPSPKLTNNNHAHVRQVLKDPDESDLSMYPSLAYALANHSDDDLDSDDGDLRKPVSAAYETVDLNPAGRVLEHGASVHSNLYASTAIVAPNPPTSSNPSTDYPPQYAVPDKNKHPSSKADDDAIPTESPYAIVHPDPENPMVRASLRQRATEGHVNAAYDSTEEGFVENNIYEPAGR